MPANMISAAVGSTLAVSGSSMATVSAGPMPGSTPMAVPRKQPTRAHIRLIGVMAMAKPCISRLRVSMDHQLRSEPGDGQQRQIDAEQEFQQCPHRQRDAQANQAIAQ